jgi:hypothetical protein
MIGEQMTKGGGNGPTVIEGHESGKRGIWGNWKKQRNRGKREEKENTTKKAKK